MVLYYLSTYENKYSKSLSILFTYLSNDLYLVQTQNIEKKTNKKTKEIIGKYAILINTRINTIISILCTYIYVLTYTYM